MAESFFSTLEHELLAEADFASRAAARPAIFEFITWYNGDRRHSTLGYVSPMQYERQLGRPARALLAWVGARLRTGFDAERVVSPALLWGANAGPRSCSAPCTYRRHGHSSS